MKFTCGAEKLREAILIADRTTGKNLALPVLGTVLMVVADKKISIRATNLSLGVELQVPAVISRDGVAALRGDIIAQYLSGLKSNDEISCELVDDLCIFQAKKSRISVKTFPYEDFPTIPAVEGKKMNLPASVITKGVTAVSFASAVTDIKPEIASIHLYTDADSLVFVATDSFRLAEKKVKLKQIPDMAPILIPVKNMMEVARILEGIDDDIIIEYSQNQIAFRHRNIYITSRLVVGTFPDYKQIIPKGADTEAIILRQDLLSNLKMANVFSGKLNQLTLTVDPQEKKCIIHVINSDLGEETGALDGVLSGAPVSLSVNLRYLLDCFQSISSDSVSLIINSAQKPVIVRGVDDRSFLYLLMPMNR